jgi:hypothetical protein
VLKEKKKEACILDGTGEGLVRGGSFKGRETLLYNNKEALSLSHYLTDARP